MLQMNLISPFIEKETVMSIEPIANMDGDIGVDFSFFSGDEAKKIDAGASSDKGAKKKSKPKVALNGEILPERNAPMPPNGSIAEVDYARSYTETNNLIRGTIIQADELGAEIKADIDTIRASKTLKNKYNYITNLASSAGSILSTKIAAIKELNSTITQAHNLELNRLKALKLNENAENDDKRMMDLYSSFINTPIGSYVPNTPTIQDLTIGVNNMNSGLSSIELPAAINGEGALSPEQNRMRMEANPNIQVVVRYDQSTGQRCFDVIDKNTGASVPNYPRPDGFLLEDTTIDIHAGIARNRNINSVWPLVMDGQNTPINEY